MQERSVWKEAMPVNVKEQSVRHLSVRVEANKALGKSGNCKKQVPEDSGTCFLVVSEIPLEFSFSGVVLHG